MSGPSESDSMEVDHEGQLPPAEEAWSVPVPEADHGRLDLGIESMDDEREEDDLDMNEAEMPRSVEAWTDEPPDEFAVAADPARATDVDDDSQTTDFPEPVETWSIAGVPAESEED